MAAKTLMPSAEKAKKALPGKPLQSDYPFFSFLRDMNKMIDNLFNDFGMAPASGKPGAFTPSVDVVDTGKELTVTAELPGMSRDDIDISLGKDAITIKGEKKAEREEKGKDFHLLERSYGSFSRSVSLPVEVRGDEAKAVFKNGVLSITLPKAEAVLKGTKKIPIRAE
ncbi:MAG TPA: Hsp20/alpha crystallin family protein [Syntrophorhabdaceae bacterium]|jgi:HSP20 family protein